MTGDNNLTYNRFDYYSGSQITVWFGNIMIDDINSIQWSRSQNKKPIYGYASQQFDAVANGTIIIQGSFIVNFRQSGYISLVMKQIASVYNKTKDKANWPAIRTVIGSHLKNGTFGPKTAQELGDIANSPDFLGLAKAYEDIIWGDSEGDKGLIQDDGSISYENKNRLLSADVAQSQYMDKGFTILVTYGNNSINDKRRLNDYMQSTVKALNGVHIVGDSQILQVGGQGTQEQYDFIARGTDEQLSSFK